MTEMKAPFQALFSVSVGLFVFTIVSASLMVCGFILDGNWIHVACAIAQTLLATWMLSNIRKQVRFNKADRIANKHLEALREQVDAGVPNTTAFEHHLEQVDAALEAMKQEQL